MATVLSGQDSVSAAGMQPGHDVYCGYGSGAFKNMASVMARFPGKLYISISTSVVSGVDCYDIEPGGGSASQAPAFFRQWKKVNTDKPVFYASSSNMSAIQATLSAAGISRSSYYLWVASWNGSPAIPSGYDGHQYANAPGYDSNSFYDYMWTGGPTPPPATEWPLAQGSTYTADVKTLQGNLNNWASTIGLTTPLVADGKFGKLTAAAATLAQRHFGDTGPAGTVSQVLFNTLKGSPGTTPPPPSGSTVDILGYQVGKPTADGVPAVISWNGDSGQTSRMTVIPNSVWQGITWTAVNPSPAPIPSPAPVPVPTPTPSSGYRNPLRGISNLVAQRVDQGVDYAGSGPLYSLGNGTVLNVKNAGWPGGTFISVRLSDGPAAGKIFYFAENIVPAVTVGQKVTTDTVLGTLVNAYPNSELGWAAEPGTGETMARAAGNLPASHANTAYGKNFSDLLVSLGAPAGILSGPVAGSVAAGWPTW